MTIKTIPSSLFETAYNMIADPKSVYIIPAFQRPYTWDKKQIEDLLQDLEYAALRSKSPSSAHHYLSTVHLIKVPSPRDLDSLLADPENSDIEALRNSINGAGLFADINGGPLDVYTVVDGQQRITTLLFLYIQRFILISKTSALPHHSQFHIQLSCGLYIPRFIQNPAADHNFMKSLIASSGSGLPPNQLSQHRMTEAWDMISKTLKGSTNLLHSLTSPWFQVAMVELDRAYALGAFMALNDRGKSLTVLEKLKAILIEYDLNHAHGANISRIHQCFGRVYNILNVYVSSGIFEKSNCDSRFTQYISVYLRAALDVDCQWQSGEAAFECFFRPELHQAISASSVGSLILDWITNIDELCEQMNYLAQLIQPSSAITSSPSIFYPKTRSLRDDYEIILKHLKLSPSCFALLMKFRAQTKADWHTKFPVRSAINSQVKSILSDALHRVESTHEHIKNKAEQLNGEIQKLPSADEQCEIGLSMLEIVERIELSIWRLGSAPRANFMHNWVAHCPATNATGFIGGWANWWQNSLAFINTVLHGRNESIFRYILMEYESYLGGTTMHFKPRIELEHIFPQEPNFPTLAFNFSNIAVYHNFIYRCGNLTYLYQPCNATLGNSTPNIKSSHYSSCPGHPHGSYVSSNINITKLVGDQLRPIGTNFTEYKNMLELRCVELGLYTIGRFKSL